MNLKKGRVIFLCCLCALLSTFFILFADISVTNGCFGECVSMAFFEKQNLSSVDKIIVTANGREIVCTDESVIRNVIQDCAIATHVSFGCPAERKIDLFSGDRLVRSMEWSTCEDYVKVYTADAFHWMFSPEGWEHDGFAYLSDNVVFVLNELIESSKE